MNQIPLSRLFSYVCKITVVSVVSLTSVWENSRVIALAANPQNSFTPTQNQLFTPLELALNFRLPPRGAPGNRVSPASRGDIENIVALVPGTNFGYTTDESPSLWVYFPYSTQKQVRLTLKDRESQQIYQQEFTLPGTSGFVKFSLPETVELEVDKMYFWEFEVSFKPYGNYENPIVRGAIERVTMDNALKGQLVGKSEREILEVYADNGLWFDVLSGLISLQQSNPEDEEIASLWVSLFEQIFNAPEEIKKLKDKPFFSGEYSSIKDFNYFKIIA